MASLRYAFKLNKKVQNKDLAVPPLLRRSIFLLASLLASMYLATAADAWLHASSQSINLDSVVPFKSGELATLPNFGRQINATKCDPSMYPSNNMAQKTCGQVTGAAGGNGRNQIEGYRTKTNSSSQHRVVYTDDQTAILVPQTLPDNTTYIARTIGFKSQCATCDPFMAFLMVFSDLMITASQRNV